MPPSALPEPSAVRRDHVVLDFAAHVMRCEHCGTTSEPVVLPIDISALLELTSAFLDQHENCPLKRCTCPELSGYERRELTGHEPGCPEAPKESP